MVEYIEREALDKALTAAAINDENKNCNTWSNAIGVLYNLPAADVAPVVRCEDCEYSYDEISYLCCSHGVCFDCEVPPNFYCAEGKRKENDE